MAFGSGSCLRSGRPAPSVLPGVARTDLPNLFRASLDLKLAGQPAPGDPAACTRLDSQTLLHHQLFGPPGSRPPPRLEGFPSPCASRDRG